MSSVPPLLTPTLPPTVAAAAMAAPDVVVLRTAMDLTALRILEAAVVSQQKDGTVLLKADFGTLQVKLPVTVADGSRLTLQVGPPPGDGGFPTMKLTSVDGRPVNAAMMAGRTPVPAVTAQPAGEIMPSAGGDTDIMATVVRPAGPSTGAPPLLASTAFPVRLLSVAMANDLMLNATSLTGPASGSPGAAPLSIPEEVPQTPATGTPPSSTAGAPLVNQPAAVPSVPTAASPSLLASTTAPPTLTPTVVTQDLAQGGAPPSLPATLTGTVAPNTLAGQPLIQTNLGLITLQGAPSLPAGAQVALQVTGPPILAEATAPAPTFTAPWSGLSDALSSLGQSDPAAAARLTAGLPELGPRLAAGMMTFVAAAQNSVLRPVVGERAAQALEKIGRGPTGKRLLQELDGAAPQLRKEGGGGNWEVMPMPLLNGAIVEPVRLYLRRPESDQEEGGTAGGQQGQRFVIDVSLSALGRLQIDGLMRRSLSRLSVLVRTAQPLPSEMRQDIVRIFADCCSASGVSGEAGFQVTQKFIDLPMDAPPPLTGVTA